MIQITIDIPEGSLASLHKDPESFAREMRIAAAAEVRGQLVDVGLRLNNDVVQDALAEVTEECWPGRWIGLDADRSRHGSGPAARVIPASCPRAGCASWRGGIRRRSGSCTCRKCASRLC